MSKRQKKFVVLFSCLFLSVLTCLSGLSLILFKDNHYKSEYHTALSAAAYAKSRNAQIIDIERQAAIKIAYQEMLNALRYNPYNALNWRRLAAIIRLSDDPYASAALARVETILKEFEGLKSEPLLGDGFAKVGAL